MKSKYMRSLMAVLGIAALLIALVAAVPSATNAANLSGGSYTYVIDGEEVTFTFDPIIRKDGMLLPVEVFQNFDVQVDGLLTREFTLSKLDVTIKVNLGTPTVDINGVQRSVAPASVRLNGRVFLAADLLKEFGIDIVQDGNYVFMQQLAEGLPAAVNMLPEDFNTLRSGKYFPATTKADNGVYIDGEYTLLTPEILNVGNLGLSYGVRARLARMLQTNTLVLAKLSNKAFKAASVVTTGLYMTDMQRNQYDLAQVFDVGNGLLSAKMIPGADRVGVLVFPKVAANANVLTLYYDTNNATLGNFTKLK